MAADSRVETVDARSRGTRNLLVVAFLLSTAFFVAVAMEFDLFSAGRAFWPVATISAVFGLPSVGVAVSSRRRWMRIACAMVWTAVIVLMLTPWHPRKLFVSRLFSVTEGMTVDDVERIMRRYTRGPGRKWAVPAGPAPLVGAPLTAEMSARVEAARAAYAEPAYPAGEARAQANGTTVYRWCEDDWQYDSDWGLVTFRDGRVVNVDFSPD